MSEKLKPCPFCGGDNVKTFGPVGWHRQWGISHSCPTFYSGSSEMAQGFRTEGDAIAAWNRRAPVGDVAGGVAAVMPPRIWAWEFKSGNLGSWGCRQEFRGGDEVEYIRADIHDSTLSTLQAELEAAREALDVLHAALVWKQPDGESHLTITGSTEGLRALVNAIDHARAFLDRGRKEG